MENSQFIGKNIIKLETVNSTNQYLSEIIQKQVLPEGTIVWALNQKQGKGQKGNYWESEKKKNLLISILLNPDSIKASSQFILNKVISLGVAEFIESFTRGNVQVKWPNDIYVGDKKIAGILIENKIMGEIIQTSIIGIGININQKIFYSDAPNPDSLINITNKEYDLAFCLQSLCDYINKWYNIFLNNQYEYIDISYLNLLKNYNIFNKYIYNEEEINAKITGISKYGKLIIKTSKGSFIECDMKEITFLFD